LKIALQPSPVQEIRDDLFTEKNVRLFIKRDDLLHDQISGNKIRKLKYNLLQAHSEGHHTLLTFGGAYSNHIYAVAAAGEIYGFKTIGVIRGEPYPDLNPTLEFAISKGMHLHYISRAKYRNKYFAGSVSKLKDMFGQFYMIPEGGTNSLALKGCTEIIDEIDIPYDFITSCCGTGGTLAGIIAGLNGNHHAVGFPVLKGGEYLRKEIQDYIKKYNEKVYLNWHLVTDYHFGGYAKYSKELVEFINEFKRRQGIPLDPIYTGKMMSGLYDLISKDVFKKGSRIIAVHTGGLQGIDGFNERFGNLIE
jgi:1-aminocyclopropane-1-carboxylate deaminase/D-cysteine desulfhydrase-like pyridoxal-dependent ACC family enzyme